MLPMYSYDVNMEGSKLQCLSSWGDSSGGKVPDVLSSKPQSYISQAEQHEPGTPALLEWEGWVEARRPMRLIGQPH